MSGFVFRRIAGIAIGVGLAAVRHAQGQTSPVTAADYAAATAVLEPNLRGTVKNQTVEPTWIGDRGSFWYRRDEAAGTSYVRFDPRSRSKTPLFDHGALAAALAHRLGPEAKPTATNLGLTNVAISADLKTLTGTAGLKLVTCNLAAVSCEGSEVKPPEPGLLPSPDGKQVALIRNDNLFVRDVASGRETQLTTDGAPLYSYGKLPESSLITITRRKTGMVLPPTNSTWSPDGRYLIVPRVDERNVRTNPFVEWVPQDGSRRPILYEVRSAFTGDQEQLRGDLFVFEVATGRRTAITAPEPYADGLGGTPVGWSVSRGQVFLIARTPGSKAVALLRVDLVTGKPAVVLEEKGPTRVETNTVEYNMPNVRVVGDGTGVVWYSARSGWGHLYHYAAQTGALRNPITAGDWVVLDIVALDEARREIYFTGAGREPGGDPYFRRLYKARLDGGEPTLLTPNEADHQFDPPRAPALRLLLRGSDQAPRIRPEAGVFLDTYSTVDTPPVTMMRSTVDGHQIAEVEQADASALYAAGWHPPVREKVKAADGTTDLYADYYAPRRDTGQPKHPVIDAEYGGPQVIVTPRNFVEAYSSGNPLGESGLARFGFAMVTVDGRGTPNRSSAFRDAGYPEFTQVAIDDHIAVIRQLAERHPEMDLERVGIYGWSWGGTFAAQAILSRPKFYAVAVSGAGVYDYAALYPGFENFTGVPAYADGSLRRTKPNEAPANWQKLDITAMAGNLAGHLLLIYGDLDENVPSSQAFRLADALIKANKPYDLLYLPGRTHAGAGDPYTIRRTWDYFIEHLLGAAPVPDVRVTIKAAQ